MTSHEADLQGKLAKAREESERLQRKLTFLETATVPIGVPMEVELVRDPATDRITMTILALADKTGEE